MCLKCAKSSYLAHLRPIQPQMFRIGLKCSTFEAEMCLSQSERIYLKCSCTFEADLAYLRPILCKRGQFGLKCSESASNVQHLRLICSFEADSSSFTQNLPQMCTAFSASFSHTRAASFPQASQPHSHILTQPHSHSPLPVSFNFPAAASFHCAHLSSFDVKQYHPYLASFHIKQYVPHWCLI